MILITGAGGFLGSLLTYKLIKRGYSIRAIDNFSIGTVREIGKFKIKKRDVTSVKDVKEIVNIIRWELKRGLREALT